MKFYTAVQEGCGYKDTLGAHRYFAPLTKYFTVCIIYQPVYVSKFTTRFVQLIVTYLCPCYKINPDNRKCAVLGYYSASNGKVLPKFRDNQILDFWTLRMASIGFPETSTRNYRYSPRNTQQSAVLSYIVAEA